MAEYRNFNLPPDRQTPQDALDVALFNQIASQNKPQGITDYSNGDIGAYATNMPEGRYYTYNNNMWFINVLPIENFTTLKDGLALNFRDNLNNNFSKIKDQADSVDDNLTYLKQSLKKVATTASTDDLTTTPDNRTVTDNEKEYWNERGVYIEDEETGRSTLKYDTGTGTPTDISSVLTNFIESNIPTQLSDLANNGYAIVVPSAQYDKPNFYYWDNAQNYITKVEGEHYPDGSSLDKYKFTDQNITINNDYVAYMFFADSDLASRDFSSTCETTNNSVVFGASGSAPFSTIVLIILKGTRESN